MGGGGGSTSAEEGGAGVAGGLVIEMLYRTQFVINPRRHH